MKKGMEQFDPVNKGEAIPFDKPKGWTSFDVVAKVRDRLKRHYGLKKLKVGHAGTLDPMATGLLVLCCGPMTRSVHRFQDAEKEYVATVRLGEGTPSHDAETQVERMEPVDHITQEQVERALKTFEGETEQKPPAYSALRVNGKRAYEEARKGKDPKLEARRVRIEEIRLESLSLPEADIRIRCGKGTYIRSIARDLGETLGTSAHLTALRRTRIGEQHIDEAWTLQDLEDRLKKLGNPVEGSVN